MSTTVSLPATQARNSFFELLDAARFMGQVTEVLKNGKVVALIVPPEKKEVDWATTLKELKALGTFLTEEDAQDIANKRKQFDRKFPGW